MVSLIPLNRTEGRALWAKLGPDCAYPRLSTKWFEARIGKQVIGWCCCRYLSSRPGREATLISEGAFIDPAFRGRGLQNDMRMAMVDRFRSPGSKRKITVQTYVNAENIGSLRNCVKAGLVPYKTTRENTSVFVHLEGKL